LEIASCKRCQNALRTKLKPTTLHIEKGAQWQKDVEAKVLSSQSAEAEKGFIFVGALSDMESPGLY